ncbi:MAG: hypothetical protein HQL22_12035 [Candidatus Omnitrophica bacterium]|nr:hypothetical protein [Candidatus Omnitrophota bacterium]
MKWISLWIVLCAFMVLRPYGIEERGLCYTGDDQSYFAHATAIVFGQFPSYDKEYFTMGDKVPDHPIGCSLMAVPFVYVFSWIDRWTGAPVVAQRTKSNVSSSWSMFGFVAATSFYFWFACFFLFLGLRYHVSYRAAVWAVILMVLLQGVPLYVYRRPIFSHTYWLFLHSLMTYFLLRFGPGAFGRGRNFFWKMTGLGGLAGLMLLTRHNNAAIALMWPVVLVGPFSLDQVKTAWSKLSMVYATMLVPVFLLYVFPFHLGHVSGLAVAEERFAGLQPMGYYIHRIFHIFFGIDWGLVYLQPFLIIGLAGFFFLKADQIKRALFLMLLMIVINVLIVAQWGTQASYYGYRYLVFVMIPLLIYPLARGIDFWQQRPANRGGILLAALAVFPALAMLLFEGNPTNLTLTPIAQDGGQSGWGNSTYVWEVFRTPWQSPVVFLTALLKGGPLYWIYIIKEFVHVNLLPFAFPKYAAFQWTTLVRTVFLYLIPVALLGIFWKYEKGGVTGTAVEDPDRR